jgi:hypothetical protein
LEEREGEMRKQTVFLCSLLVFAFFATNSFAVPISWTNWTSATIGSPGTASGIISPIGGTDIDVSYSGEVWVYTQTGTGTNYWVEGTPAPYTGNAIVDNAPTAAEMISLYMGGITNTISFSQPVENLIMAIVSQGRPYIEVSYAFDTPFTVLSEGAGHWGIDADGGTVTGNTLLGEEFNGVIQFNGTVSSISWVNSPNENYHGITVGVANTAPIPEPATLLLLGSGIVGLLGVRKKLARIS